MAKAYQTLIHILYMALVVEAKDLVMLGLGIALVLASFFIALYGLMNPHGPWPLSPMIVNWIKELAGLNLQGELGKLIDNLMQAAVFTVILILLVLMGYLLIGMGIKALTKAF